MAWRWAKIGAEASWLLEDNHLIVKPMRAMGAREWHRWRVYDRAADIGLECAGSLVIVVAST